MALGARMFQILKTGDKAAFAFELLWLQDPKTLKVPSYIHNGLKWLEEQLTPKHVNSPASIAAAESQGGK